MGYRFNPITGELDLVDIKETFETISKNLFYEFPATLNYTGGALTSIDYGGMITKTLHYTTGVLTSITLSGTALGDLTLTKTLNYTDGVLTSYSYS